jgi:hypothetical protein
MLSRLGRSGKPGCLGNSLKWIQGPGEIKKAFKILGIDGVTLFGILEEEGSQIFATPVPILLNSATASPCQNRYQKILFNYSNELKVIIYSLSLAFLLLLS